VFELDDDTRDALAETFNLALGHAALHFADLVREEVELTVPQVALIPCEDLVARIEADSALAGQGRLCSITQRFRSASGDISTQAILLFSERGSLDLLQQMLPGRVGDQLGSLEQEALGEVGNVILNACMNRLAEVFDRAMTGSLPRIRSGEAGELLGSQAPGGGSVLWAGVGMRLAGRQVDGQVVFVMDMASLERAIRQVRQFFGMASEPA
jgi:chemotaxis protein CheC